MIRRGKHRTRRTSSEKRLQEEVGRSAASGVFKDGPKSIGKSLNMQNRSADEVKGAENAEQMKSEVKCRANKECQHH
jgi:hypothetical protein